MVFTNFTEGEALHENGFKMATHGPKGLGGRAY